MNKAAMHRITLIPGDGIGPEVINSAVRIIEAAGVEIDWDERTAGLTAFDRCGNPVPEDTVESIRRNGVALKGPIGTPIGTGFRSVNVALRQAFDLYANLRPVVSFEGVPSKYGRINLTIVRENTEEFYAGRERFIDEAHTVAETIGVISRINSERIAGFAYEYARANQRRKITIVHKANILKNTHGLFLETARRVGTAYPEIITEDRIVDNMAMQLVLRPEQFDVILAPNLIGDILSDLCAGLVGGLGLVPGANIGNKTAIFEAVHGTAPDIAGRNIANPTAVILSAAMMLEYLGERNAAERIKNAVKEVLR
ncbi:MAG: isocitrate/isopropylmalate dehydrogenase family protein, partial [Parcubacteria group bacterium]|nr:isocitrate/isopropylmalate dehydrogenase family protein [Parcubacteria group bacterium]